MVNGGNRLRLAILILLCWISLVPVVGCHLAVVLPVASLKLHHKKKLSIPYCVVVLSTFIQVYVNSVKYLNSIQ